MARQFILPTNPVAGYDPSTVFDENNNPLTREQFLAAGGAADGSNVQRLPTLNSRTGTSSTPQQVDPITQFNKNLMELLTRAQGMGDNGNLIAQRGNFQNKQITNSMKPADQLGIEGLAPGDMLNARQNEANLYNPEVRSLNDRMQLNNEAVSKFESALSAAKSFGEDYAKYVKPDEATITAVKQQMAAGFLPSATVIEKIGKYLTSDDWNALNAADIKQKKAGQVGPQPEKPTVAEKKGSYLASAKTTFNQGRGTDTFINPDLYRDTMNEFVNRGLGDYSNFQEQFPIETYISPQNRTGDLKPIRKA